MGSGEYHKLRYYIGIYMNAVVKMWLTKFKLVLKSEYALGFSND